MIQFYITDWFRRKLIKAATSSVTEVLQMTEKYPEYLDTIEYKDFKSAVRKVVFNKKKKDGQE